MKTIAKNLGLMAYGALKEIFKLTFRRDKTRTSQTAEVLKLRSKDKQ